MKYQAMKIAKKMVCLFMKRYFSQIQLHPTFSIAEVGEIEIRPSTTAADLPAGRQVCH